MASLEVERFVRSLAVGGMAVSVTDRWTLCARDFLVRCDDPGISYPCCKICCASREETRRRSKARSCTIPLCGAAMRCDGVQKPQKRGVQVISSRSRSLGGASALSSRAVGDASIFLHFNLCIWGFATTSRKAEGPNGDPEQQGSFGCVACI